MSSRDPFSDLKRSKEEEYFRKKEQDLIDKLRERARLERNRKEIAEATGVADETILRDLHELGFIRDTVLLLHIVPLINVAWAEGHVTSQEREKIIEIAQLRGVEPGSSAYDHLQDWLRRRPSEEFFREALRIVSMLLSSQSPEDQQASKQNLVSFCTEVASASGGILGFGPKISDREKAVIERIAAELDRDHHEAAERVVQE